MSSDKQKTTNELAVRTLIDRYCTESITEQEVRKLDELICGDRNARNEFRLHILIHAMLYEAADSGDTRDVDSGTPSTRLRQSEDLLNEYCGRQPMASRSHWWILSGWIAAGLMIWFAGTILMKPEPAGRAGQDTATPTSEGELEYPAAAGKLKSEIAAIYQVAAGQPMPQTKSPQSPVAIATELVEPKWAEGSAGIRHGDSLGPGMLRLQSGLVKLAFISGAIAVVEGPAELELADAFRGVMHHGKIRLVVPPQARGFVIETDKARYIDLGTEFGVEVGGDGSQEIHVFDGQVKVHTKSGSTETQLVNSGGGLIANNLEWDVIRSDPERFADVRHLRELAEKFRRSRFEQWLSDRTAIAADNALVAYYDFERDEDQPNVLKNLVDESLNGAIVGCEWTSGRWSNKGALEFRRPNDRVRLNIPGEFESLTMTAWVRIGGLDRSFSSLLLTDVFEDGDVHWQIRSDGTLDLGIKPKERKRLIFVTPQPVLLYEDLARWVFLAVAVNHQSGTVAHYIDGKRVLLASTDRGTEPEDSRLKTSTSYRLRIGRAELGNWTPLRKYDEWSVRNFNGRIDEFSIYSKPLSDAEITDLYRIGAPNGMSVE